MKLVLLGDEGVGKTTLVCVLTTERACLIKMPGIFDVYPSKLIVNSVDISFECWCASTSVTSDSVLRIYQDATAILICFAADDYQSFENAKSKWYQEASLHAPNVPVFLVKTKSGRPHGLNPCEVVSAELGKKASDEMHAQAYMECSSHYAQETVHKVFETVAKRVCALGIADVTTMEQPGLRSWMRNNHDIDLVEEAIKWGATRDHLSSQFNAALYLDTFRAQGHYVCAKPAWVITKEDFDIFYQAFQRKCPPAQYATKQRALLYIDQMRAEGRAVWVRPTWVTDESTTELYETAVARRAPARLLNSHQATKLFLLGADDKPSESSWFSWWT